MSADFDSTHRSATFSSSPGAYPWRAKAGIAIMLLMAALAVGTFAGYRSVLQQNAVKADSVTLSEQRFQGLRAILPRRGVVGYLSDAGKPDAGKPKECTKLYYLAQYSLAPVVVAPDANHELVVANFASSSTLARLAAANGLTVVRDFKNGVALLRRESR